MPVWLALIARQREQPGSERTTARIILEPAGWRLAPYRMILAFEVVFTGASNENLPHGIGRNGHRQTRPGLVTLGGEVARDGLHCNPLAAALQIIFGHFCRQNG